MKSIKWIHLSDLHLNEDGVETDRLREALIEYLRSLNVHCDYVFFTGDVRYAPYGAFPADAAAYLHKVCDAVNAPIERLFVVPGNHDISRDQEGRDDAVKRIFYQNEGYYDPMEGTIKLPDLQILWDGQEEFRKFLSVLYAKIPERLEYYQDPKAPHFCITTEELNIVHMDSTLTYTSGQERDLITGTKLLLETLKQTDSAKPTLLLTHYSYDFLHRNEQKEIFRLMQDYHIQLWLAGHEHDHLCRLQRECFYELQCGNLVLGDKAKSCVLMGSMDLDTGEGEIKSHAWFPQGGWAQYPFIRTGAEDNTRYPFTIVLSGCDAASDVSPEERNVLTMCRTLESEGGPFYNVEVHSELMPDLQWNTDFFHNEKGQIPLMEAMRFLWERKWKEPTLSGHALLLGDGGMGKSTMLFHACKQLIGMHMLTVYASLNMLQAGGRSIQSVILRTLYGVEDERAESKLQRLVEKTGMRPSLTLLIDGFNELSSASSYQYAAELKQLAMYQGIQVVVSSRLDFLRYYGMSHFQMLKTCDLHDRQIMKLFEETVWQEILSKRHLHILLKNPMMALIYAQTSRTIEQYRDLDYCDWKLPVSNASDLMHNYYLAQVALTLERSDNLGEDVYVNYSAVKYVLPYLGFCAESENRMAWDYTNFDKALTEAMQVMKHRLFGSGVQPENLQRIKQNYRVVIGDELPKDAINDAIISKLCLLRKNKTAISFPHQIYRDYLAAVYLYDNLIDTDDVSELWEKSIINEGVAQYLRHMHGELWGENGLLTRHLLSYRGVEIPDGDHYVENLLNCWLSEDAEQEVERDLSGLDLRKISLSKQLKQKYRGTVLLNNAKVSQQTFVSERRHNRIGGLAFSHDGRMLSAVSANGIVSVSNIGTQSQMIVGELELGGTAEIGYTTDDYLLLKIGEKVYKWTTISYDKIEEMDVGSELLTLPQEEHGSDPAEVLYQMLKDSDMLGTQTVISEDRTLIAVGNHNGSIQIWSTKEQIEIAELSLGDGEVTTASFSPNGEIAAVGAGGALIQLWNIQKRKCQEIRHFDKPIRKVCFPATTDFSKCPYLECLCSDGHCLGYNIHTGESSEHINKQEKLNVQKKIRGLLKGKHIQKIEVADNGNAIVQLNSSNELYVWDNQHGTLNFCRGHNTNILDAAICGADPRYAASHSSERISGKRGKASRLNGNKVIRVWAIRKGNCMQRLSIGQRTIQRIQFFTTNRIILAGFATNGDIMLWELINKTIGTQEWGHWNFIDTIRGNSGKPLECAVATNKRLFVGVNTDGTVFSRTFSGEEKSAFRIFPGIDLTPLRWDALDCDEKLKSTLQAYLP